MQILVFNNSFPEYTCSSDIINITLLFDEGKVFLKAALNTTSNSEILHLKLKMLSLPLLSFVKIIVSSLAHYHKKVLQEDAIVKCFPTIFFPS